MKTIVLVSFLLASAALSPSAAAQDGVAFDYSFRGPWKAHGEPGGFGDIEFEVLLASSGLEAGQPGPQGWSLGVVADGARIIGGRIAGTAAAEITDPVRGYRQDGFENTQVTAGPGNEGLVSAVILSLRDNVSLPHDRGPQTVLFLDVEARFPPADEPCETVRLRFVDGLRGTGQTVDNKVVLAGRTHLPRLHEWETRLCPAGPFGFGVGGDLEQVVRLGTESSEAHPFVLLRTDEDGVQGWSLSVESEGDCELEDATTRGTIGAESATDPFGLRNAGFEKTELARPENNAGRSGAVSAVVLSFALPVTVPIGEHRILALDIACDTRDAIDGQRLRHRLFFPDNEGNPPISGQLTGSGQPVKTAVTHIGETVEPNVGAATVIVDVRIPRVARFVRCDPNADEVSNIADAIWLVNELFRGGRPTLCPDAGDCNDDESINLADAVFAIDYQFNSGAVPPAPFPDCGLDDGSTESSCPAGSTPCL